MAVNLNSHSSVVVFNGCYPLHPAYPFQFHHHPLANSTTPYGSADGICGRPLAAAAASSMQPPPHVVSSVAGGSTYLNGDYLPAPPLYPNLRDDLSSTSSLVAATANNNGNRGSSGSGGGKSHRRSHRTNSNGNNEPSSPSATTLRGVKGYGLSHVASTAFHSPLTATSGMVHSSHIIPRTNGNFQGMGHSSKSLTQSTSGGSKNSSNMIAVPPHQMSPSGIQSHNSNQRTSSFAAALRKLAEQATDPLTDKELLPVSPADSPTSTNTLKRVPPLNLIGDSHSSSSTTHIQSVNLTSPTVTMASTPSFIDGRKNVDKPAIAHPRLSSKGLFDEAKKVSYTSHRPHSDLPQEDTARTGSAAINRGCPPLYADRIDINSSPAKITSSSYLSSHQPGDTKRNNSSYYGDRSREEHSFLSSRQPPSQPLHLRSPHTPTSSSRLDEHIQANSSFQPYRSVADELRHGLSPHISSNYDTASSYSYHPAFLPPQLHHSPFRFDDPLYLERCNMFRPPLFPFPHPGVLPPHHALPFFPGSRYTPELMPHPLSLVSPTESQLFAQERLKLEEQRRERSFDIYDQDRNRSREKEQERESEYPSDAAGKEQDKCQRTSWSVGHNGESSEGNGVAGSITQGIPRTNLLNRTTPTRSMLSSPTLRIPSNNSAAELVTRQTSRHNKSPTETNDRNEMPTSFSSCFNTKALLSSSSSVNQERSSVFGTEPFNLSRPFTYESSFYDVNSDATLLKKTKSETPLNDTSACNSVTQSVGTTNSNFTKINHLISDVTRSCSSSDALKTKSSWVDNSAEGDFKHKKRSTVSLIEDKLTENRIENENHAIIRTLHRTEDIDGFHPFNGYLKWSPTSSYDPFRLEKCDPIVKVPKLCKETLENCDPVKSKLDIEAEKSRLKRFNNVTCSDDEHSDTDSIEVDKIIIFSGPPLSLDTSKKKLNFLSSIGLVTHKRRCEIELDQYLKRKRVVKADIKVNEDKVDKEESSQLPWFLEKPLRPLKYSTDELRREPELSQKVQFFLNLNLNLVSLGKKEENAKILRAVVDEKIRRNGYTISKSESITEIPAENDCSSDDAKSVRGLKRPIEIDAITDNDQSLPKLINSKGKAIITDNHTISSVKPDKSRISLIAAHTQKKLSSEPNNGAYNSVCTDSNQYRHDREFAQKFHNSVWQQTKGDTRNNDAEMEITSNSKRFSASVLSESSSVTCHSDVYTGSTFNWPGIEILIGTYQNYRKERNLEREILSEQCAKLLAQNRELNSLALHLNQKAGEYINLQKSLNEERCCLQQTIDNLKCFLKQLR